jgi:hypothetical protein
MKKLSVISMGSIFFLIVLNANLQPSKMLAEDFYFCGPSGGVGGIHFSDAEVAGGFLSDGRRLVEVRIRSGALINAIQTVYVNVLGQKYESPWHGGAGGTLSVFTLAPDEYITRVNGKYGAFMDHLEIITNKGHFKGWGGTGGQIGFVYNAPPGSKIHGFFGHSGDLLDSIGVFFKKIS